MRKILLLTVCALAGLAAAHPMHSTFSQCTEPAMQTEATLIPDLGHLFHKVSTQHPQAQAFFNQGLTLLFSYNFEDAVRSFRQAAKLDPQLAMAQWGIAMASGANININIDPACEEVAFQAISEAQRLAGTYPTTAAEKAYINALAARYTGRPNPDLVRLAVDFKLAQQRLTERYPQDTDARIVYVEGLMDLRPWMLWLNGKPNTETSTILGNINTVLKQDPDHLGANHYNIHALEASDRPELALNSALKLSRLVPNAGHMQHMPSHIFMRLGNYQMSRDANLNAVQVDQSYYQKCFPVQQQDCLPIYVGHYYSHNLMFLAESYAFMGASKDALATARKTHDNALAFIVGQPELEHYVGGLSLMQVGFQKWQDILAQPRPLESLQAATALWHWSRSYALAALGQLKEAESEQQQFFAVQQEIPYNLSYGNNTAQAILAVASNLLRAKLAAAQGNMDAALELLKLTVDSDDALVYDEPPPWFFPARDALGAAYFQTRQYQAAVRVFKESLKKQPLSPRALYGLALSQKAVGDPEWEETMKKFQYASRDADVQFSMSTLW
ncbi:tetratricopeptide repeat protein [Deinococcus cellulosilyticus]|uniref:Tetratricopeptide repeat protein n=1 Tax=Deinococcus cellulosilyticus (strain DSM 18568 / NBRC 106333 / KACC 11606 / 5516J-15) TaxID=1223518 RepID=A0A511N5Z7_DEIC1|nr:tetratricopeptide repeat protein [Deinococcus cellulosilyticus]GEM48264.1 hypothetical protein DC3_38990 [Deinococcus cellulosilyticus NBRC 106333 = KACC 11606]